MRYALMWTVLAALGLLTPAFAEDAKAGGGASESAKTALPSQKQLDKLAAEYGVPVSEVQSLRTKGLGWGEIGNALAIAQKSGQPLSAIIALRDSGMGWGKIARKYGFKLGDVKSRAKTAARMGQQADREERREVETPSERGPGAASRVRR